MATSPNFVINGNSLPSPSRHKWLIPEDRGIDGLGMKRYQPYFSYEISWSDMSKSDFDSLNTIWKGQYGSGTSVVKLPQYDNSTYQFTFYSGCVVDKPTNMDYNENFVSDVKIIIRKISI